MNAAPFCDLVVVYVAFILIPAFFTFALIEVSNFFTFFDLTDCAKVKAA